MNDRDEFDRDDPFEATRMPLGGHIEELRHRLWRAIIGFGAVLALCFLLDFIGYVTDTPIGVGRPAVDWICLPVEQELEKFHERRFQKWARELRERDGPGPKEFGVELDVYAVARELAAVLGLAAPPAGATPRYRPFRGRLTQANWWELQEEMRRAADRRPRLATMGVTEAMTVYIEVTLVCGVVLASPWVFWQLWGFFAAGLYPHEKRCVHRFLPFSLGLFLAGAVLCQFLVVPRAVEALLWFNEWLGFEPELRLSEWLGFTLLMPLVFGVAFQTPLAMLLLERLGVLSAAAYRGKRRLAWFVLAVFAAVITPSVDWYSMFLLWIPMGMLYELGIWLCVLAPRRPPEEDAVVA
jgi:sec-independent protein translocase protein TatC